MRRFAAALALGLSAMTPALAQDNSVIAVPLAPPIMAAPVTPAAPAAPAAVVPPGLVQTPMPPANSDTGANDDNASDGSVSNNGTPMPDGAADVAVNAWQPQQTARLGVLDKVDGSSEVIAISVGGVQKIGDLQVQVLACVVRPAGHIPDAAMFVAVTPADGSTTTLYRGWMIKSAPGAAVVGDAGETFRVAGCL